MRPKKFRTDNARLPGARRVEMQLVRLAVERVHAHDGFGV